jgi:hypothetical protein
MRNAECGVWTGSLGVELAQLRGLFHEAMVVEGVPFGLLQFCSLVVRHALEYLGQVCQRMQPLQSINADNFGYDTTHTTHTHRERVSECAKGERFEQALHLR